MAETCAHDGGRPMALTKEEHEQITAGVCSTCEIQTEPHGEEGWRCTCCGVQWKLEDGVVTIRAPYVVTEDA